MNNEKNPYDKICKYKFCKQQFPAKRTNQEFCCDDHYRKHNNGKAKLIRDATKAKDYTFHQNWLILKELYSNGTREIDRLTLEEKGYKLFSCTHSKKKEGTTSYVLFCYDYGLATTDNKNYKILKDE